MSDYGSPPPPPYGSPPPPYGGMPPGPGPGGPPPPNNLVWAILTTIFCCLPLGVVSIVFAAQVNSKWQAGDVAGAQESANRARQFAIFSAVAGLVVVVLYVIGIVVAASMSSTSGV
jgi:predicted secreted protein